MGRRLKQRIDRVELPTATQVAPSPLPWDGVELISHQWFSFNDSNGGGCCEADHYLIHPRGFIILLECKLTQTDSAIDQMVKLYVPVLKEIYGMPVIPVQVCKNMRYQPDNLITDIEVLLKEPRMAVWTWHYLAEV